MSAVTFNKKTDRAAHGVNYRLLAITLIAMTVIAVVLYFWHQRATSQLSRNFLDRSAALAADGDYQDAAEEIWKYLRIHPEDADAQRSLADYHYQWVKQQPSPAGWSRCIDIHNRAIGLDESANQNELIHRLAEMMLSVGRFNDAKTTALKLFDDDEFGNSAKKTAGIAAFQQVANGIKLQNDTGPVAGEILSQALQANPGDPVISSCLATLYRSFPDQLSETQSKEFPGKNEQIQRADQIMDDVIAANPDRDAFLARYRYRAGFQIDGADEDLDSALKLDPENAGLHLEVGLNHLRRYIARKSSQQDSERLNTGSEQAPLETDTDSNQSSDEEQLRTLALAEAAVRESLRLEPDFGQAIETLGDILSNQGQAEEALVAWERALALSESGDGSVEPAIYLKLAEANINQQKYDQAEELLEQLKSLIDTDIQKRRIVPRKRVSLNQSIMLMRGVLNARQGRFIEARPFLKQAVELDLEDSDAKVAALQLLGECYANTGVFDVAAECYGRASQERPNDPEFWRLAGNAWTRAGQSNQAIQYYEKLSAFQPTAENWLSLAFVLNAHESSKLAEERNPEPFRSAFAKAVELRDSAAPSVAWRIQLLEILNQFMEPDGLDSEVAKARLDELAKNLPDDPIGRGQLMFAYEQIGDSEAADSLRQQNSVTESRTASQYLSESQLVASRGKIDDAIKILQTALKNVPEGQRTEIRMALVDAELASHGDVKKAIGQLVEFWNDGRNQLLILKRIADLTIGSETIGLEPQSWEADLPLIEGKEGHWSLFIQSSRDVKKASQAEKAGEKTELLQSAALKQQQLARLRPLWPPTHTLAGDIASSYPKKQQTTDANQYIAVDHYKRAIELGERRPLQVLKLVYVLYVTNQLEEAEKYLPMIGALENSQLGFALSHDILLNLKQYDRAEVLARKKVDNRDPDDVMPLLGLGQILMAQNRLDEAEEFFQQVADSDNDRAEIIALMSLFNLYLRQDEKQKATEMMDRLLAVSEDRLDESEKFFLKGQTFELLKDPNAGEWYEKAAKAEPGNADIWTRGAVYFARQGDLDKAIAFARKVRTIPGGDSVDARALLLALLAERGNSAEGGNNADWDEILRLRRSFTANNSGDTTLEELFAMLLTIKYETRNSEKRKNLEIARNFLTEIGKDVVSGTAVDHLRLARIYQQFREIESDPKERRLMTLETVKHHERAGLANDASAGQLRVVANFFLNEELLDKADELISRITELDRETIGWQSVATLALRIQLLAKRDQLDAAQQEIDNYVNDQRKILSKNRKIQLYQAIGEVCLKAQMYDQAEVWLRKGDDGSLSVFRYTILTFLRQENITEALQLCQARYVNAIDEPADVANNSAVIQLVSGLLSIPGAKPEHFDAAEKLIALAQQQLPDDADAINAIATIRLVQGQHDEAIGLFRKAVDSQPANPVFLNNLATALSSTPESADEALKYINRAIEAYGRETPALLDTKASILIHADPAEAEAIWREINNDNADPRITFQLADLLYRQDKFAESRKLLDEAVDRGLLNMTLTPAQQQRLNALQADQVNMTTENR